MLLSIEWTAEAYIAACALIISIGSIILTLITLKYQREHNYKSLRPIGVIVAGDYEDKIFIRIDNNGIGPLIIRKVIVKYKNLSAPTVIEAIPQDLMKKIPWTDFASSLETKTIAAGQKIDLLVWSADNYPDWQADSPNTHRDELRKVLSKVTITLYYTDVYEKNEFKEERIMDWFGRHFQ